jgi:signal transduction histidine kinase
MSIRISFNQIDYIINSINRAESAQGLAERVTIWLGKHLAPALIGLHHRTQDFITLVTSDHYQMPAPVQSWMESPRTWQHWQSWSGPVWLNEHNQPVGLKYVAPALLIPLRHNQITYGILWIDAGDHPLDMQSGNGQLAIMLAGLIAARLHHLSLNTHWNNLVSHLNDFSHALALRTPVDDLWTLVHDQLASLFQTSSFFVALRDSEPSLLYLPVVSALGQQQPAIPMPNVGITRYILQTGIPLHFRELPLEDDRLQGLGIERHTEEVGSQSHSWLGVPIRDRNNMVIGVIALQHTLAHHFNEADLSLLMLMAVQLAQTLEHLRVLEAEQDRRRIADTLIEVTQVVTSTLKTEMVMERILDQIQRIIGYDRAFILLPTLEAGVATIAALQGQHHTALGERIRLAPDSQEAWSMQEPVITADAMQQAKANGKMRFSELMTRARLTVPMVVQERVTGLIVMEAFRSHAYSKDHASTAFALARQAAIAVENARLHEATLETTRLKDEFLANMSHELRTPLNAITGYSEMLLSQVYGELNSKQYDRLARVVKSGRHLQGMITQLLDLSRIEAGRMNLLVSAASIGDIIYAAIADLTPQIEAKGLRVHVELNADLPRVECDSLRIQQVISNLMGNAIKFTPEGGITVRGAYITIRNHEASDGRELPEEMTIPDGDWLAVSVVDTGVGISEEAQEYIFQAFRQADSSSVREYEGFGLGLAICQQLVRLHHGYLWVESTINVGSTFTFVLPITDKTSLLTPLEDDRTLLLLISTNPETLDSIQQSLAGEPYQVTVTTSPGQAVEIAQRLNPAVVLIEWTAESPYLIDALEHTAETTSIPRIALVNPEMTIDPRAMATTFTLNRPVSTLALLRVLDRIIQPQQMR